MIVLRQQGSSCTLSLPRFLPSVGLEKIIEGSDKVEEHDKAIIEMLENRKDQDSASNTSSGEDDTTNGDMTGNQAVSEEL